MRFDDRRHAGALLGQRLVELAPNDPVVYSLPRGGVPVGFEVARALRCPLDVMVVRKVGVPYQPELAMGAVAESGIVVRNEEVLDIAGVPERVFDGVVERELAEVERRVSSYRGDAAQIDPAGRTAIVVDDGLATGSTALAAVEVLRAKGAAAVWLAVPVAPPGPLGELESKTDRIVALSRPSMFGAVGVWYRDFTQTSDREVRDLLAASRLA